MPSPRKISHGLADSKIRRALISSCVVTLLVGASGVTARDERLDLFPRLQAGQTITYRIAYNVQKQTKTQSSVSWAQTPAGADINVQGLLRMDVLGVKAQGRRSTINARTWFESFNADAQTVPTTAQSTSSQKSSDDSQGIAIDFTVSPNGRIDQLRGLDALSPDQQQGWQQWATTFAAAAAFPTDGIKLGQKWKSEEPEKSSAPLAGLVWTRESTYLRNEPCRAARLNIQGDVNDSSQSSEAESCAVVQTTATLKQKPSAKKATPEDFKLHSLRTFGAAGGSNKTLLYISLVTGVLIRASDQADQSMNVIITKSDGSNHVRYDIHAKSITDIFRVANSAPNSP
jgi:hypothetical protein